MHRLPLFVWAMLAQSVIIVLCIPVLAGALTMILTDRNFNTAFYDPAGGGNLTKLWSPPNITICWNTFIKSNQQVSNFCLKQIFQPQRVFVIPILSRRGRCTPH